MNKSNMLKIDNLMNAGNAGAFASLVTVTRAGIIKPCGKIVKGSRALKDGELELIKRSEFVTQSKTSYLNRAKKKDATFELSPRAWGERVSKNLVSHKDSLYLETIHDPSNGLAKPKVTFTIDGVEISREDLEARYDCTSLKPRPSKSGIEVRTFKSESIRSIKLGGEEITA